MERPLFQLAVREERRIRALATEEPWKQEHEKVMRLYELEYVFTAIRNAVEVLFKADNYIHGKAAETGDTRELNAWIVAFGKFLKASAKAIRDIKADAKHIGVDAYGTEALTIRTIDGLQRRLTDAQEAIKEWAEWKQPVLRKTKP